MPQNKKDKLDPDKAVTSLDVQKQLAAEAAASRGGGGAATSALPAAEATAAGAEPAAAAKAAAPAHGPLRLNLTGALAAACVLVAGLVSSS